MLRIRLLRLSRRMTIWDLSKDVGVSQGRLSMLERGLIDPTPDERARLAVILGTSAATLFRPAVRETRNPACAEVG